MPDEVIHVPDELRDNIDLDVQELLLAASNHDIGALRTLLRGNDALVNAQDPDTGFSALHAAIAACEEDDEQQQQQQEEQQSQVQNNPLANGHTNGDEHAVNGKTITTNGDTLPEPDAAGTLDRAKATVQWLLQRGAIWNELSTDDETPGCIAYRLGLKELYGIMVDAGTRAELLLSRLDEYEEIEEEDDGDGGDSGGDGSGEAANGVEVEDAQAADGPLGSDDPAASNEAFLRSELTFQPAALLDRDANGVMMDWESEIMQKTADLLLPSEGLRVLNIGHGMGIIDRALQSKKPASHHIIEAHPAVIEQLKATGWADRPGVGIHEGSWQEVVPKLLEDGVQFDAVFYDTFAEDYKAFKALFEEHMIGLLDDSGRWGFFNGLGADRQISYDVYKNILSMDLQEAGYDIDWTTIEVPDLASQGVWEGMKRPYWTLKQYHLPICSFFS